MNQITHIYNGGASARMGAHLRYINESMTILTWPPRQIQFVSAHARIGKGAT